MPRYTVEYYFAETQIDEVEAQSEAEASKVVMDNLYDQYNMLGRPTDMILGIRDVRQIEEDSE